MSNEQNYDSSVGIMDNQKIPEDVTPPEGMPQVNINESPKNVVENNDHINANGCKWPFVILIISVVISSSIGFCSLSKHYDDHLEKIISFQRFNSKELERIFSSKDKIFYNKDFFETLQTKIEEHEASEEALLELSFAKLQSDFNFTCSTPTITISL